MRTEPRRALALAIGVTVLAALAGCGGGRDARRPDGLDVSAFPPAMQQSYEVFAYHCSRCHSLARPLTAQVDDVEHWRQYVERMRRQPGSGITRADAAIIVDFLVYWTAHRREAPATYSSPAAHPTPSPDAVAPAPAPASTPDGAR